MAAGWRLLWLVGLRVFASAWKWEEMLGRRLRLVVLWQVREHYIILNQVENGVAVRMAVMYLLVNKKD